MLIYNLERILKARGIDRPTGFFKNNGFSPSVADKLRRGKFTGLHLPTVEKLCKILNCAPHDLMEWIPDEKSQVPPDHPLHQLKADKKPPDITPLLKSIPLNRLKEVQEMLEKGSAETVPGEMFPGETPADGKPAPDQHQLKEQDDDKAESQKPSREKKSKKKSKDKK